ncbi:hypothetical protein [Paenibacillus sp. FSL H8-0332]|uniref:hypothetical protein n=1 Tax=Paenibacillus sp. FSL H8-0332 TaxID=2954742 RepID=UPI0030CABC0B
MEVVNPLFRKQDNAVTAAHACNCICNEASENHSSGSWRGWVWGGGPCGCACNSTETNSNSNYDKANG